VVAGEDDEALAVAAAGAEPFCPSRRHYPPLPEFDPALELLLFLFFEFVLPVVPLPVVLAPELPVLLEEFVVLLPGLKGNVIVRPKPDFQVCWVGGEVSTPCGVPTLKPF
jgi:hypothetical protein